MGKRKKFERPIHLAAAKRKYQLSRTWFAPRMADGRLEVRRFRHHVVLDEVQIEAELADANLENRTLYREAVKREKARRRSS